MGDSGDVLNVAAHQNGGSPIRRNVSLVPTRSRTAVPSLWRRGSSMFGGGELGELDGAMAVQSYR